MHAKQLLEGIHVQSLVSIAQAVFLLEREQTRQTDATEHYTHTGGYTAGMGKYTDYYNYSWCSTGLKFSRVTSA